MSTAYPAFARIPGDSRRSVPGTIRLEADGIRFQERGAELDASPVSLSYGGLVLRVGGAREEALFLEHPSHPGLSVWSLDPALRHDPAWATHPRLRDQLLEDAVRNRRRVVFWTALGLLFLGAIGSVFLLRYLLLGPWLERVPVEWEEALGNAALGVTVSDGALVDDPRLAAELESMTARLVDAAAGDRYQFRFHVVQDETVNAFAVPGGHVVLHSGLILEARTPEEVAGVLAHEMAHVLEQHGLRAIMNQMTTFAILQAIFGDPSGLAGVLTRGGTELLSYKFSRDQEREADAVGLTLLVDARIDPAGMIEFFHHVRRLEEESSGGPALSLLRTHPLTEERLSTTEAAVQSLPTRGWEPLDVDLGVLRQVLTERADSGSSAPGR